MVKLNLGCASRLLSGYINIDLDSLEQIKERYPNIEVDDSHKFLQANILELPFEDETVDEVRADAFLEHLSFKEEPIMFREVYRVLKPGGVFKFSVPDFEDTVKKWPAFLDHRTLKDNFIKLRIQSQKLWRSVKK